MFKPVFLITAFVLTLLSFDGTCQKKNKDDIQFYMPTESISWGDDNRPENAPKRKSVAVIYKSSAVSFLYGNPCAVDATMAMGFIYDINIKGAPGSVTPFKQNWNNMMVNIKLIFTRSPFWKLILNKRIKNCRERSGDFVG